MLAALALMNVCGSKRAHQPVRSVQLLASLLAVLCVHHKPLQQHAQRQEQLVAYVERAAAVGPDAVRVPRPAGPAGPAAPAGPARGLTPGKAAGQYVLELWSAKLR